MDRNFEDKIGLAEVVCESAGSGGSRLHLYCTKSSKNRSHEED